MPRGGRLPAHDMFRVNADALRSYLDFDPIRKIDLQKLDKRLKQSAPGLKRYFHRGTPAGEPGMRFRMIGYGKSHYPAKSGQQVEVACCGRGTTKELHKRLSLGHQRWRPAGAVVHGQTGRMSDGPKQFQLREVRRFELCDRLNAAS
jgi:hypothetical protein